jgi:hypothetical protein
MFITASLEMFPPILGRKTKKEVNPEPRRAHSTLPVLIY